MPVICCSLSLKAVKMSSKNTVEDKNVTEEPSRGKSYTGTETPNNILGFIGRYSERDIDRQMYR